MADNTTKVAAGAGLTAAVASIMAYLRQQPSGGDIALPPELMELLAQWAAETGSDLSTIIQQLQSLSINVQGFPPNGTGMWVTGIPCTAALTGYRGPDVIIPEGMFCNIKNTPANPVGTIIYVSNSMAGATNAGSSYPLALNDSISYQVQNAKQLYVGTNIAGAIAIFTAENPKTQEPA